MGKYGIDTVIYVWKVHKHEFPQFCCACTTFHVISFYAMSGKQYMREEKCSTNEPESQCLV